MEAKELGYVLYSDNDYQYIGFNRFSKPGFIDDGFGWTDEDHEEFFDKVLSELHDYVEMFEAGSFTYEVHTLAGLEDKLKELGITKHEQGWEE